MRFSQSGIVAVIGMRVLGTCCMATLGLLAWFSAPAEASTIRSKTDIVPGSAVERYLYSDPILRGMKTISRTQDHTFGIGCEEEYQVEQVALFIGTPIEWPPLSARPTKGAWLYRFKAVRCGETKLYNIGAIVQDEKLTIGLLPPGNTITTPLMASNLVPQLKQTSKDSLDCRDVHVFDTVVLSPPPAGPDGAPDAPWTEAWTLRGCGRDITMQVRLTPDGAGGTTFSVTLPE